MSRFALRPECVASFIDRPTAVHGILIDAEATADGAALIVRSKDKTSANEPAALRFTDANGAPVPVWVATGPADVIGAVAVGLRDFYKGNGILAGTASAKGTTGTDAPFIDRYNALTEEARAALGLILPIFGAQGMARNGWPVGSFAEKSAAAAMSAGKRVAKSLKDVERLAKVLNNAEAMKAAAQAGGAPIPAGIDLSAMASQVAALMASLGVGAAAPTGAPVVPSVPSQTAPSAPVEQTGPVSAPSDPAGPVADPPALPPVASDPPAAGPVASTPSDPAPVVDPTPRKGKGKGKGKGKALPVTLSVA
jgi:hypothetical protein